MAAHSPVTLLGLRVVLEQPDVREWLPRTQSILRGAQVGFVNVGDGNLTVARRDLVVIDLLPIVVARIHDSSAADGGDFGPGWRLSIAETITLQADGAALLLDESGSSTRFVERGGRYVQEIPHPTDITSLTRRNGYIFEMHLSSGLEKRYRLLEGQFRLSRSPTVMEILSVCTTRGTSSPASKA